MKKNIRPFVAGCLVTLLLTGLVGTALATVGSRTVTVDYNNIKVTLDGQAVNLVDANGNTVEPFSIAGTTYLPIRAVASALGLNVSWDSATSTAVLTTKGQSNPISTPAQQQGTEAGNYSITIDGAKLANDYYGDPAVIVTYTWTNNSDEAISAFVALSCKGFQQGVQLETALMGTDSGFDPRSTIELKPGASTTVQSAFKLNDTTSPLSVEITELLSFEDTGTVSKTFELTGLK